MKVIFSTLTKIVNLIFFVIRGLDFIRNSNFAGTFYILQVQNIAHIKVLDETVLTENQMENGFNYVQIKTEQDEKNTIIQKVFYSYKIL